MPSDPVTQAIWQIVEPWLAAERVELDDVDMVGTGKGRTLRILVDHEDGLDLDRIAALSDGISRLLDEEPSLADPYQLEVSSPGLERKLRRRAQWVKSVGRDVTVKMKTAAGNRTVKGVVKTVDDDGVLVELSEPEAGDTSARVGFDDVVSAKTVYRWDSGPKPGKK